MKGMMRIQKMEKMPWIADGIRHAQVEFMLDVPKVIPAAINPPEWYVCDQRERTICTWRYTCPRSKSH